MGASPSKYRTEGPQARADFCICHAVARNDLSKMQRKGKHDVCKSQGQRHRNSSLYRTGWGGRGVPFPGELSGTQLPVLRRTLLQVRIMCSRSLCFGGSCLCAGALGYHLPCTECPGPVRPGTPDPEKALGRPPRKEQTPENWKVTAVPSSGEGGARPLFWSSL